MNSGNIRKGSQFDSGADKILMAKRKFSQLTLLDRMMVVCNDSNEPDTPVASNAQTSNGAGTDDVETNQPTPDSPCHDDGLGDREDDAKPSSSSSETTDTDSNYSSDSSFYEASIDNTPIPECPLGRFASESSLGAILLRNWRKRITRADDTVNVASKVDAVSDDACNEPPNKMLRL